MKQHTHRKKDCHAEEAYLLETRLIDKQLMQISDQTTKLLSDKAAKLLRDKATKRLSPLMTKTTKEIQVQLKE